MISLDQVYLLEQKVESAVAKIQQLQAENDALRNKCAELTNALTAKSEQLSSIEQDQSQIESGIKKALDRLNSIENSVLKAAGQALQEQQVVQMQTANVEPAALSTPQPVQPIQPVEQVHEPQALATSSYSENQTIAEAQALAQANVSYAAHEQTQPVQKTVEAQPETPVTEAEHDFLFEQAKQIQNQPNFDSMQPAFGYNQQPEVQESEEEFAENADDIQDDEQNPGFDIF